MDTSGTTSAVASPPPKRSWRRHSDEFRARVIELARQPNTSVAAVALANGLNANMLRGWVRKSEAAGEGSARLRDMARPAFVPLPMPTQPSLPAPAPAPEETTVRVEVEIHRNGTTVRASLPLDSCSAAWLREVTA